jgi:hypothetical protein
VGNLEAFHLFSCATLMTEVALTEAALSVAD